MVGETIESHDAVPLQAPMANDEVPADPANTVAEVVDSAIEVYGDNSLRVARAVTSSPHLALKDKLQAIEELGARNIVRHARHLRHEVVASSGRRARFGSIALRCQLATPYRSSRRRTD